MGTRGPKPGSPRVGGRQKGTPNKATQTIKDQLQAFMAKEFPKKYGKGDYDPLLALAKLAETAEEEGVQVKALGEISSYIHAKRKAVELTGADGGPLDVELKLEATNRMSSLVDRIRKKHNLGK